MDCAHFTLYDVRDHADAQAKAESLCGSYFGGVDYDIELEAKPADELPYARAPTPENVLWNVEVTARRWDSEE